MDSIIKVERPMSAEFRKVITDFIFDIVTTFPEYAPIVRKWWTGPDDIKYSFIYKHCVSAYPDRFFDILYQNVDIFNQDSDINTDFLPGISFKYLWKCDISDKTRETIWRYLQMILLSIVGGVDNAAAFGDTAKLFQNIDEDDFKEKLLQTLEKMQDLFPEKCKVEPNTSDSTDDPPQEDIEDHMKSMLGGKLGSLAREIAEETSQDLEKEMENVSDIQGIFKIMFQNPGKLMNLVKEVGDKIDSRLKSGDVDKNDLMNEATELMSKMKGLPGMDNVQDILRKMGMGDNKTGDFDLGSLGSLFGKKTETPAATERKMKNSQMRDKLKKKMEDSNKQKLVEMLTEHATKAPLTDEQLYSVFNDTLDKKKKKNKN